jgi:5-methylcytosine-specific restriction protein A
MPTAPRKPCAYPGCHELIDAKARHCKAHEADQRRRYDERRGSSASRGYDHKWRERRLAHLKGEPLCRKCLEHGRITAATVADHITPHRGDAALFCGPLQSLCASCHSSTKQREEGGEGRISGALR